jgi:hypothetical protein
MKLSQRAIRNCRIKAFGNNFCVEDATSTHMQTYDNGVVSLFIVPTVDTRDVPVNYIGVVKDIFKLNYGPLSLPRVVILGVWRLTGGRNGRVGERACPLRQVRTGRTGHLL